MLGGMISSKLTSISGSSDFFEGSIVSYSNYLKKNLLKVPKTTINKYGASKLSNRLVNG